MKKVRLVAAAAVAGALAGCISYQQHIKLNADGSGKIIMDMWMDDIAGLTEGLGGTAETAAPAGEAEGAEKELTVPDEMGPAFQGLEGVTIEENWIRREEAEDKDGTAREHSHLVLTFDKLERLNGHGVFTKQELAATTKGKKIAFSHIIRNDQEKEEAGTTPEAAAFAREILAAYTFTYTIEMPAAVTETNGSLAEDNVTVTWRWPLYELSEQKEVKMTATAAME